MNHKQQAHTFMKSFLNPNTSIVLDMTCGNGYDTLFLAEHSLHVYAIDIQAQAIMSTYEKTKGFSNITYILADHATIDYKKIAPFSGAIYNLGYLPQSNKEVITQASSTLSSLEAIWGTVTDFVVIACYLKHEGGYEEYEAVREYLINKGLPFQTLEYETPLSPVTFLIDLSNT